MAGGKRNTDSNGDRESVFNIETVVNRLDRIHSVLKEVDEIKHSIVEMATVFNEVRNQRTEMEVRMIIQEKELTQAKKEIQDLNKENEHLKRSRVQTENCNRCCAEIKRTPLSEIQPEEDLGVNVVGQVETLIQEEELDGTTVVQLDDDMDVPDEDVNRASVDLQPEFELTYECEKPGPFLAECQIQPALEVDAPRHYAEGDYSYNDTISVQPLNQACERTAPFITAGSFPEQKGEETGNRMNQCIDSRDTKLELLQPVSFARPATREEYRCRVTVPVGGEASEGIETRKFQGEPCSKEDGRREQSLADDSGRRHYRCSLCNYMFKQKRNLTAHMRIHTGERPFECDLCGKTFNQKGNLKAHVITHTGERPFKCDFCNATFNKKNILVRHVRCHTGEKPYQCLSCDATFAQRSSLVSHAHVHTGERL